MSTSARKRLMRDFKSIKNDPPQGVNAMPRADNIMQWDAVIFGPEDAVWEGGTFRLLMEFTEEYPNKAPVVKFVSTMFHPNIYADGAICLDILQNMWSAIYDVSAILTSIQSLLGDPNPNSPANAEAAKLYAEDRREYIRRVKEVVEASWKESEEEPAGTSGKGKGAKEPEKEEGERGRDPERGKERDRERDRDRDRERDKGRDRDRDRGGGKDRSRDNERGREREPHRSGGRRERSRSRERDRKPRERDGERDRDRDRGKGKV